jgi:hypothetical protein
VIVISVVNSGVNIPKQGNLSLFALFNYCGFTTYFGHLLLPCGRTGAGSAGGLDHITGQGRGDGGLLEDLAHAADRHEIFRIVNTLALA